jgi:hypothetical protein
LQIPFLRSLLELQFVSSLLQGFLPSLVLLIFLAVLPYLLGTLIRRAGLRSITAEDSLLTLMYFLFQLFAVSYSITAAAGAEATLAEHQPLAVCISAEAISVVVQTCGLHSRKFHAPLIHTRSLLNKPTLFSNALQVFIFSFVSGTALSQLQALLDDPHKIVSLLGVSAPQQASFFSTYILLLVRTVF